MGIAAIRSGCLLFLLAVFCCGPALAQPLTTTTFAGPIGGTGANDGAGSAARFSFPEGVATDAAGNLYVADRANNTIRKVTPAGETTTLAGRAGIRGSANGIGAAARFYAPSAVALDGSGNVFVADTNNHTIRKITPGGAVITIAGVVGSPGAENGPGNTSRFNEPTGVAVDAGGNAYVADSLNHTIRRITPAGVVTTFAGTAGISGTANGTGNEAQFNTPVGLATDSDGNIYVADWNNHTIRKISPTRVVTTLAGVPGASGNANGSGSDARFFRPSAVATDSGGNIYVADTKNHTIRTITAAGVVATLAGEPGSPGSADGTGNAARFNRPEGVAAYGGIVYVADTSNHTTRRITSVGTVTTLAGLSGGEGRADGTGSSAQFYLPAGVAAGGAGNVWVADTGNHTIRKITPGGIVSTLAGSGGNRGSADGSGGDARFFSPKGVAVDDGGNVYVADTGNHTIRKIKITGGIVTTLAGSAGNSGSANGSLLDARFKSPKGVAVDGGGNVYVADTGNHTIRKITPDGIVSTLAGSAGSSGSANGAGTAARFSAPAGVAVDDGGKVYVADTDNHTIRKITPGGLVTTVAGQAGVPGSQDGTGSVVLFFHPSGIAVDSDGSVLVADTDNKTIRRISLGGVVVTTTPAGDASGYGTAEGTGDAARFFNPEGVSAGSGGKIYVADTNNNKIRLGEPALADVAFIDSETGKVGVPRQLFPSPQTGVSFQWKVIRRPGDTNAMLSSEETANPTFTPDKADLYQFRLEASDSDGVTSITTVDLEATESDTFSASGAAVLSESCSPPNNAVDPGEAVTVSFTLRNDGSTDISSLVATLRSGGGVTAPSAPQSYGALIVGGSASRSYSFTAERGLCGATLSATFDLAEGGIYVDSVTFPLTLGTGPPGESVCCSAGPDGGADVGITVSDDADPALVGGGHITYRYTVTNAGPASATNLVVSSVLPAGTNAGFASPGCAIVERTVSCSLASLSPAASASFTLAVSAPAAAGSISNTVSVAATESDGNPTNNSAAETTTITLGGGAQIVPGQARRQGAEGAFFKSSLWLTNTATAPTAVRLTYVPAPGEATGGASGPQPITFEAGASAAYTDVLQEVFGVSSDTAGSILVEVTNEEGVAPRGQPAPIVTSRTFNDSASGTYGQYIPAVPLRAGNTGDTMLLYGLGGDATNRSNAGVLNLSDTLLTATLTVLDTSGEERGVPLQVTVPGRSATQVERVNLAAGAGSLSVFGLRVTGDRPFVAYASKLDNITSDPIFITATTAASVIQWVDGIASVTGSGLTLFKSNLSLSNGNAVPSTVTVAFTPRGAVAESAVRSMTLAPKESLFYDDVVQDLFGLRDAAGRLAISSPPATPIVAWARTYSDLGLGGTCGQFIPGITSSDLIGARGALLQGLSENPSFRTNAGFLNVGEAAASVAVSAWSSGGAKLAEKRYPLLGRQAIFVSRILRDLGIEGQTNAYLKLFPSIPGAIYGWASSVDNESTDQTFIRPIPIP